MQPMSSRGRLSSPKLLKNVKRPVDCFGRLRRCPVPLRHDYSARIASRHWSCSV